MKKAFTLTELLMVVVVVGILASISVPIFNRAVNRARDQQAITQCKLIQTAVDIYNAERRIGYASLEINPVTSIAKINQELHLVLPVNQDWGISINQSQTITLTSSDGNRIWTLLITGDEPTCTGCD